MQSRLLWSEARVGGEETKMGIACARLAVRRRGCGPWKVSLFFGFEVVGSALVTVLPQPMNAGIIGVSPCTALVFFLYGRRHLGFLNGIEKGCTVGEVK